MAVNIEYLNLLLLQFYFKCIRNVFIVIQILPSVHLTFSVWCSRKSSYNTNIFYSVLIEIIYGNKTEKEVFCLMCNFLELNFA